MERYSSNVFMKPEIRLVIEFKHGGIYKYYDVPEFCF